MKKKLLIFIMLFIILFINLTGIFSCKKECDKHTGVIECTGCGMNFFDRLVLLIKENGVERSYANDYCIEKNDLGNTVQLLYETDTDKIKLFLINTIGGDSSLYRLYISRDDLQFTYESEFWYFSYVSWRGVYMFRGDFCDADVNHNSEYMFPYSYTTAVNDKQLDWGRLSTSTYISALIHDLDQWLLEMDKSLSVANYGLMSFD